MHGRIKGLAATGDIGHYRDWIPLNCDSTLPTRVVHYSCLDSFNRAKVDTLTDPFIFGKDLKVPILQIAGTNDFASPPYHIPGFLTGLAGPVHLVNAANYPHGCASWTHVESFRMWIDHVFFNRPLTRISIGEVAKTSDRLNVTAYINTDTSVQIQDVQLNYTAYSDTNYFKSVLLPGMPDSNYMNAVWVSTPMTLNGGGWQAGIALKALTETNLAYFASVKDRYNNRIGHASTSINYGLISGIGTESGPGRKEQTGFTIHCAPNPFNPLATITVDIHSPAAHSLSIFNSRGMLIRTWFIASTAKGSYKITWDGRNCNGNAVAGGLYLIRLIAGDKVYSRKAVLLR